jgi:hypothetical protein
MRNAAFGFGLSLATAVALMFGASSDAEAQQARYSDPTYQSLCVNRIPRTERDRRFCEKFGNDLDWKKPLYDDALGNLFNVITPKSVNVDLDDEDDAPAPTQRGSRGRR